MTASTTAAAGPAPDFGSTPDQPVGPGDRLVTLDFIRGIAVLGILFANITAFGQSSMAYFWPPALSHGMTPADEGVWLVQYVLIDGKFRGLFSVLFGAGMVLFIERAWANGASRWLQFRRLVWLLVFGLLHYFLIWDGDILTLYAIWGIVGLSLLRWNRKRLLVIGLSFYLAGSLFMTGIMASQYLAANDSPIVASHMDSKTRDKLAAQPQRAIEEARKEVALIHNGSFADVARDRVKGRMHLIQEVVIVGIAETLALMMLGMAFYRYGLFSGALDPDKMRKWGWTGLIGGGLLSLGLGLWPLLTGFPFFTTLLVFNGLSMFVHFPMILGLAALLSLWAPTASTTWLGERLVATGRMAFSNYLGTSIVMLFVFRGTGLGLAGAFDRLQLFGVVLVAWIAMLAWSKPWLEHFRYGPLEWLWRCLTYWNVFPLRRRKRSDQPLV